jgi:glycosyltransferase involved in cell wall biosynthesis
MPEKHKRVLIVLGMHRSGTSVLSGCLNILGLNFGNSQIAFDHNGQTSIFENRDIVLLNDILLRDIGCKWDMVGSLPQDWLERRIVANSKEKISNLVKINYSTNDLWTIHDPRLCRLMPLWMDVFNRENIEPCFVLMVRHPLEVAKSLEKRDGFDLLKGHLLWLMHTREALAACDGYKHAILTYDSLLGDPISCFEKISRELDIDFLSDLKNRYHEIIEFVRQDLKHHHCGIGEKNIDAMYAQYAWLYDQFRKNQSKHPDRITEKIEEPGAMHNDTGYQDLAISGLKYVSRKNNQVTRSETSHVSKMFNNLLDVISRYEQADYNREIQRQRLLLTADQHERVLYAQVYLPLAEDGKDFTEENSKKVLLAPNEWQKISVSIPAPELLRQKPLRFDPLNTSGVIKISTISLVDEINGNTIWAAVDEEGFQTCKLKGNSFLLDSEKYFHICATDTNSYILLPTIAKLPDKPMRLDVWIKVQKDLGDLKIEWIEKEKHFHEIHAQQAAGEQKIQALERQLGEAQRKQQQNEAEINGLTEQMKSQQAASEKNIQALERQLGEAQRKQQQNEAEINGLTEQMKSQQAAGEKNIQALERQLGEAQQKQQQNEAEINGLTEQMKSQQAAGEKNIQALERQLGEAQRKQQQNEAEINGLTEQMKSQQAANDHKIQAFKRQLKHAQKQIAVNEDLIGKYIKNWFNQLNRNLKILVNSKRWIITNKMISILSLGLFRIKKQTAMDNLKFRIQALEKKSAETVYDINSMSGLIQHINDAFYALIRCRRWQASHLDILLLSKWIRKNRCIFVVDQIETLLDQFKEWRRTKIPVAPSGFMSSAPILTPSFSLESNIGIMKIWSHQLVINLKLLISSKRWVIGNNIISILSLGFCRIKKQTAVQSLKHRIQELETPVFETGNKIISFVNLHDKIHYDFNALIRSFRWRLFNFDIGNLSLIFPTSKSTLVAERIKTILLQFKEYHEQFISENPSVPTNFGPTSSPFNSDQFDTKLPNIWFHQLLDNLNILVKSKRWALGNKVVSVLSMGLFKIKKNTALDSLQNNIQALGTPLNNSEKTISLLVAHSQRFEEDFNALIHSFRWRAFYLNFGGLGLILPTSKMILVIERIKTILNQFKDIKPLAISKKLTPQGASAPISDSSSSLNVVYVLHQSLDRHGGSQVKLHAQRLKSTGADYIIAVPTESVQAEKLKTNGDNVRTFEQIEKNGLVFADNRGPDIVHAWTPRELVRIFCEKLALRYPCPLVIHLESNEEYLTEISVGKPFATIESLSEEALDDLIPPNRYHPIRGKKFLSQSQGITVELGNQSRYNFADRPIFVLPPPVDERLFYPRPMNIALREELGITEKQTALIYIGNVHAGNREEARELYRAVHLLNEKGCPTVLIRIGENDVSLGNEDWIQTHEINPGPVPRIRIPDFIAAADVLVHPGAPGPFNDLRIPSKLPEYFAMGRPMVLPRTNLGLKVKHGQEGYVLDRADGKSIAEAVLKINNDKRLSESLAAGSVDFYLRQFGSDIASFNLSDFYRKIRNQNVGSKPYLYPSYNKADPNRVVPNYPSQAAYT